MSCIHHDLYHAHMTLYLLIILIGCEVVRSHDTQSMDWMIYQQQKLRHLPIVTIMSYFKEFKCRIILQSLSHILHTHALFMQLRLTFW